MFIKQQINRILAIFIFILLISMGGVSSTAVANVFPRAMVSRDDPVEPIYPIRINISGYVIAHPPCMINDGKTVEINFGEILSTQVDGSNYKRPINYNASCEQMPINTLNLSVDGNGTFFDENALTTNIPGLGVRILYQNKELKLGQKINFTYPDLPVLEAVPVRDLSTSLTGGDFSATATLRMEYQ